MNEEKFDCPGCGAQIEYDPGAGMLQCPYCGIEKPIPKSEEDISELDFHEYLENALDEEETVENLIIKCPTCSAESTLDSNVVTTECPFCGTHIGSGEYSKKSIKPKSLLPFKVTQEHATASFKKWLHGLWFAPNSLKREASRTGALKGIYIPYWTFDCNTTSWYTGERGEDYYVMENVRSADDRTGTRRIRKTRWYPASGWVWNKFDDILVMAASSLPDEYARKLEPWDLVNLVPYDEKYMSGLRSESYQVNLEAGFDLAAKIMESHNRDAARRDIGGDHQRVHSLKTQYDNITFKHILLPIYISAFRFKNKVYRFMVNGRTSEVQGARPWSVVKILAATLAAAAAVTLFIYFAK